MEVNAAGLTIGKNSSAAERRSKSPKRQPSTFSPIKEELGQEQSIQMEEDKKKEKGYDTRRTDFTNDGN